MPTLKQVFTLPSKAQWVEIARRVLVTFGSAFSASLAANEAGVTNLHTAQVVGIAAASAGLNALYRVFVTPAVAIAKDDASVALDSLAQSVQGALRSAGPVSLQSVLKALPTDLVVKVLQADERVAGAIPKTVPAPLSPFAGDASQPVPPPT